MKINNVREMKQFGEELGALFSGGVFLELIGDVGAGKTTLTKGIALGLGISDEVASPSFTISRTYDARDELQLTHFDFYRLHDAGILTHELAEVSQDTKNITIVEWADIVKNILPKDRLQITVLSAKNDEYARDISVECHGTFSKKYPEVSSFLEGKKCE